MICLIFTYSSYSTFKIVIYKAEAEISDRETPTDLVSDLELN